MSHLTLVEHIMQSSHYENQEIGYTEALEILTPQEIKVLKLIGRGYTYKETKEILNLSIHTVHTHVKNIKGKLNIKKKYRGLVVWYRENQ